MATAPGSHTSVFLHEIKCMMYSFGDCRSPSPESAALIEDITHKQMTDLIVQAAEVTTMRGARYMNIEDVLFLLRKDKDKLRRMLRHLNCKDMVKKASQQNKAEGEEETPEYHDVFRQPLTTGYKKRKISLDFLAPVDQIAFGFAGEMFDRDDVDELQQDRLERQDAITRNMDAFQYAEYSECRQANFHKNTTRFKEWLGLSSLIELKPNQEITEVFGYLAYETVRELVELSLLVKRDMETTSLDPCTSHHLTLAHGTPAQFGTTPTFITTPLSSTSTPGSPSSTPSSPTGPMASPSNAQPGNSSNKTPKKKKRQKASVREYLPDAMVEIPVTGIMPTHIREALRRYNVMLGPLTPLSVAEVYYVPELPPTPTSPSPTHSADDSGSGSDDSVSLQMIDLARQDFKGVVLVMDDQCDTTWMVPKGVEPIPLFQTSSFFVEKDTIDFVGEQYEHFTFDVHMKLGTHGKDQESLLLSSYSDPLDRNMYMQIDKMKALEELPAELTAEHFSLKAALEEGFFSDLTICSAEGQQCCAHRAVLSCCCPGMKYQDWEVFLSSLPTPLLKAALYYVYTDCLPLDLKVPQVQELQAAAGGDPRLSRLTQLCKAFIENHSFKTKLMQLIDEIYAGLELARKVVDATEMSNPVKITYAAQQLAKEGAIVATKFCLLCELYSRNKKDLSKSEKQELLEYCRARVVVFVDQFRELLERALNKWDSLTEAQWTETVHHIIPEVERIWDLLLASCRNIGASKNAYSSWSVNDFFSRLNNTITSLKCGDLWPALSLQFVNLRKASQRWEVRRLKEFGEDFDDFMEESWKKREEWKGWTLDRKTYKVVRGLQWAFTEAQGDMQKLEELKKEILVKNTLKWRNFKIMVTMACSYVSYLLRRALSLKDRLRPIVLKACKFVQRRDINQALVYLGLLEEEDLVGLVKEEGEGGEASKEEGGDKQDGMQKLLAAQAGPEVPLEHDSQLAKGCQQLLESQELCDMQLILMPQEATPTSGHEGPLIGEDGLVIPAHRVIVAARSEWFRKALQSGMKEAIDRRIMIYGVERGVFRIFLRFLYGAPLEPDSMVLEELIALLAVADRYETHTLRVLCEKLLVSRVEDSTVFLLLEMADHYSLCQLMEATMNHILGSPDVVINEEEGYSALSHELQQKISTLLSKHQATPTSHTQRMEPVRSQSQYYSSSSDSSLDQSGQRSQGHEACKVAESVTVFETALIELKGIVPEASDEVLRDLLLAANCDVNRAVNFFFGAS